MRSGAPPSPSLSLATRLSAKLAHDLNNAIGVLSGHLYLLRLGGGNAEESYEEMEKSVAHLERIARRLGRLGGIGLDAPAPFDLNALARSVVESFGNRASLELERNLPMASGRKADAAAALEEVLRNAERAAGSGGEIRVLTRSAPPASVALVVEDSGTGLAPAARERLFEPFVSTEGRKGEGLGLTLVAAVAALQGGGCEVSERPGGGTRVVMRFPAADDAAGVGKVEREG